MHSSTVLLAGTVIVSLAVPAWAAGNVTVDPWVARPGRYLLVAPDSTAMRFVPNLLQPGQKSGPIALHMPTERQRNRRTETRRVEVPKPKPEAQVASAAPAPAPAAPKPQPPKEAPKQAPPAPAPQAARPSYTSSFAGPGSLLSGPALTLHPKEPTSNTGAPPEKQSSVQTDTRPPTQVAKAEPAPDTSLPGSTRRSVILFAKDATKPMPSALDQIQLLAGDLSASMTRPSSRIELRAYGGTRGDKGSDARRLSLKRALAIRQVLIDDGVNAGRIDVRAMGGAENGPEDRVDIYVRA
jgi:outer membrane protein OmpA-like peptidoglycan-associated protein